VINSRDYDFLRRAGLTAGGLHLIPNEVSVLRAAPGLERRRYLYPVRAIRRKNSGEALLLSLFVPKGKTVAITLPSSEKDFALYSRWKTFAAALGLPLEFELGLNHSLAELLGTAVCALSTSVKEGFGFSFLEPWTAGLPLAGRRIDYVCADFERAGVNFDNLYASLEVPRASFSGCDTASLEQKTASAMERIYRSFGLSVPYHVTQIIGEEFSGRESIDFGRLDEELQECVIRKLAEDVHARRKMIKVNPLLGNLEHWQHDESLIEANRRIIMEQYGREKIVQTLLEIYRSILERQVIQKISKPALLELYLDPRRLFLVGISNG
jgi:hypothetical protein